MRPIARLEISTTALQAHEVWLTQGLLSRHVCSIAPTLVNNIDGVAIKDLFTIITLIEDILVFAVSRYQLCKRILVSKQRFVDRVHLFEPLTLLNLEIVIREIHFFIARTNTVEHGLVCNTRDSFLRWMCGLVFICSKEAQYKTHPLLLQPLCLSKSLLSLFHLLKERPLC